MHYFFLVPVGKAMATKISLMGTIKRVFSFLHSWVAQICLWGCRPHPRVVRENAREIQEQLRTSGQRKRKRKTRYSRRERQEGSWVHGADDDMIFSMPSFIWTRLSGDRIIRGTGSTGFCCFPRRIEPTSKRPLSTTTTDRGSNKIAAADSEFCD